MRNDVKLGLAVGGILLAVLIVYVLVVPGSQEPGAELATAAGTEETTIAPETVGDADAPTRDPVNPDDSVAVPDGTPESPSTGQAVVADGDANDPFDNAQTKAGESANGWDWNKLLNPADTPELMSPTEVSTGGPPRDVIGGGAPNEPPITTDPPLTGDVQPGNPEPAPTQPGDVTVGNDADSSAARTHTVQEGETFSSIAASVYGHSRYYPHILRANPSIDPTRLKPGTTINLPAVGEVNPTGGETTSSNTSVSSSKQLDSKSEYRVQAGDSLERISIKLYGKRDRIDSIYEANKATIGDDPSRLKVGQVLKLPEAPTITVSAN